MHIGVLYFYTLKLKLFQPALHLISKVIRTCFHVSRIHFLKLFATNSLSFFEAICNFHHSTSQRQIELNG